MDDDSQALDLNEIHFQNNSYKLSISLIKISKYA